MYASIRWDLAGSAFCDGSQTDATHAYSIGTYWSAGTHTAALTNLPLNESICVGVAVEYDDNLLVISNRVPFKPGSPDVTLRPVVPLSATSVRVLAAINPRTQATSVRIDWAEAGSSWCDDFTGASNTELISFPYTDDASHDISATLSGLTAGQQFCARVRAVNSSTVVWSDKVNITVGRPAISGESAAASAPTSLGVDATISPAGFDTDYSIEWGGVGGFWCASDGTVGGGIGSVSGTVAGSESSPIGTTIASLTPGNHYCVRIVVTNDYGSDTVWIRDVRAGLTPAVGAPTSEPVGDEDQRVSVDVAAQLADTTVTLTYKQLSAGACSALDPGEPLDGTAIGQVVLGSSDDGASHTLHFDLTGLASSQPYCVQVTAANIVGQTRAPSLVSFVAPRTRISEVARVHSTSATSAQVFGVVDVASGTGSYRLDYAPYDSAMCTGEDTSEPHSSTQEITLSASAGAADVVVEVSGLSALSYCAVLTVTNSWGSRESEFVRIRSGDTDVQLLGVRRNLSGNQGAVAATITAASGSVTYWADYDLTSSSWCASDSGMPANSTAISAYDSSDFASHDVIIDLPGLSPTEQYCVRVVTNGSIGRVTSAQKLTLPTSALAPLITVASAPTGENLVTLSGEYRRGSSSSLSQVAEIAPASSTWCATGGAFGAPTMTSPQSLLSDAATEYALTVESLAAGTDYCARVKLTTGSQTATSGLIRFTTLPGTQPPDEGGQGAGGTGGGNSGGDAGPARTVVQPSAKAPKFKRSGAKLRSSATVSFRVPASTQAAAACTGRIAAKLRVGKHTVQKTSAKLALSKGACVAAFKLAGKRTALAGKKVKVAYTFAGNSVIAPFAKTLMLKIKR